MKLSDAHIENMFGADGENITLVRKFAAEIRHAKLVADVYFNDRKAFSSPVVVTEDSGHLIANIDSRFSFDPEVNLDHILVRVHYICNDEVLFQSYTNRVNFPIEIGDYDVDMYFTLMDLYPESSLRTHVPDSKIRLLGSKKFKSMNLDEQDPVAGEVITPDFRLIDDTNYESLRDAYLGDYMTNYPTISGIGDTWADVSKKTIWPWLAIKYNFNKEFDVVVKYKGEVKWDSATADEGAWNPVPTTCHTEGEDVPRTYLLLDTKDLQFGEGYQYTLSGERTENPMLDEKDFTVEMVLNSATVVVEEPTVVEVTEPAAASGTHTVEDRTLIATANTTGEAYNGTTVTVRSEVVEGSESDLDIVVSIHKEGLVDEDDLRRTVEPEDMDELANFLNTANDGNGHAVNDYITFTCNGITAEDLLANGGVIEITLNGGV